MKAIIVSGGNPPSEELLKSEFDEPCYIICADSGANCLYDFHIVPDYLIGDFDSINKDVLAYFSSKDCIIEKYPKDKDYTDTQLALFKAKELGVSKVVFLGCTGTRIDHTLGNLSMLLECLNSDIQGYIKDVHNEITITNHPVELMGNKGDVFSLLAYNLPVEGLTIKGAKFELDNYFLDIGNPLTLSNEFIANEVKISFNSGVLLIIKSID